MSTTQIAVRCNAELVADLDWLVARCEYDSRGDAVRDALHRLIEAERQRHVGELIAEGYRRMPPTQEELEITNLSDLSGLSDDGDWDAWQ